MKSKHPEDKTIGFKNMFLIFQGFVSQEEEGGYLLSDVEEATGCNRKPDV